MTMQTFTFPKFDTKVLDPKVPKDTIKNSERWIGFFLGPALGS